MKGKYDWYTVKLIAQIVLWIVLSVLIYVTTKGILLWIFG